MIDKRTKAEEKAKENMKKEYEDIRRKGHENVLEKKKERKDTNN